jgi:hypothetical protein
LGLYGGGNNSYDQRGKPTFHDFLAYAARLDYAVASNLNVWGSFMYAMRDSNTATPVGFFSGRDTNAGVRAHPGFAAPFTLPPLWQYTQTVAIPNVPDNYLGMEWGVGLNWKLLEGMTLNSRFAYWQPGDWFKYAYVDYGSLITTTMGGLAGIPINPNRGIDPIIGLQTSLEFDF